jgi:hypothetical protein
MSDAENDVEKAGVRALDIILTTLCGLLVTVNGWALLEIVNLKQSVASMEASGFTSKDAVELKEELVDKINEAPRWLNDKVTILDQNDQLIKKDLQILNGKLDKIGQSLNEREK